MHFCVLYIFTYGSLESCKKFQIHVDNVYVELPVVGRPQRTSIGLESVDTFCYLGDMLSAGGGVEEAVRRHSHPTFG